MPLKISDIEEKNRELNPDDYEYDERTGLSIKKPDTYVDPETGDHYAKPKELPRHLQQQEESIGMDAELDKIEKYANDPNNSIRTTREREQAGGFTNNYTGVRGANTATTLKGLMKKKGPIGFIAALILGGGAGLGFFGLTLMPVTLAEQFTNDLNDLNASQQRKTLNLFGHKVGGDAKEKAKICADASSIRCKAISLTADGAKRLEDKGFKLGDKTEVGDRVTFGPFTFPDGTTTNNGAEFENFMRNSTVANSAFSAVHSVKNGIFVVGDFFNRTLNNMGLSKMKKIEGKNANEAKKSYEASTKGEKGTVSASTVGGKNETDQDKQNTADGDSFTKLINEKIAAGEKLESLPMGRIGTGIVGVGRAACATYNMASLISATAKVKKALRFAGFALIFLTLASTIKSGDATEAEISQGMSVISPSTYPEEVEDPETGEMIPNPSIGMNALDADAYKVVAYGDQINLTGLARQFFIASGALEIIENVLQWMNNTFTKQGVRTTCQILNNPLTGLVGFLAAPLFSAAIIGLEAILPVDKMAAAIVNMAIDAVAGVDLTNDVIGKEAGEVLFIGAGMILGTASKGFGLKPSPLSEIRKNVKANHEVIEREIAMKKYEASKTPFDATNQYSFLGSLAVQVAHFTPSKISANAPLTSSVSKVLSAFPASLGMLSKNADAAFSMPVADYSDVRFDQCKDDAYLELEISPDMFCVVRYAPFEHVDMLAALDYMEKNNQITKAGDPVPGSYLEKYKKHCVDREDPWGSSSVPIEQQTDRPLEWYTGKQCIDNTVENQMSSEYTGYRIIQQTIDREVTTGSKPTTTTPISGDARALARQAANHPNIIWRDVTKTQLLAFADGKPVFNPCGGPMTVSRFMLAAALSNASKYKISVNNIGFKEDRDRCETGNYQHPKGTALDISSIEIIGGASTGAINLPNGVGIVNQYATDFLAALPLNRGGVGQRDHSVNPTFPPGSVALNGSHLFDDSNDHLHIDARNRENLMDTE